VKIVYYILKQHQTMQTL